MEWYLHIGPIKDVVDTFKKINFLVGLTNKAAGAAVGAIDGVRDSVDDDGELVDEKYIAKANAIHELLQQAINNPMTYSTDPNNPTAPGTTTNPLIQYIETNLNSQSNVEFVVNEDGSVTYGDVSTEPTFDIDDYEPDGTIKFPLPGPKTSGRIKPPEGYVESTQYWSTAELMTFQLELALKNRWSSIGNKMLMDTLGFAGSLAKGAGGLLDFAGGILNPLAWGTGNNPSISPTYSNLVFNGACFPVLGDAEFTDTFGADRSYRGAGATHQGCDIMCKKGTPVLAFYTGIVTKVRRDNNSTGGPAVTIQSKSDPDFTIYGCHMDTIVETLTVGQQVFAGQVIGTVGTNNGQWGDTVPHLHVTLRENGVPRSDVYAILRSVYNATKEGNNSVTIPGYDYGNTSGGGQVE